jgi:hypothetical protein
VQHHPCLECTSPPGLLVHHQLQCIQPGLHAIGQMCAKSVWHTRPIRTTKALRQQHQLHEHRDDVCQQFHDVGPICH